MQLLQNVFLKYMYLFVPPLRAVYKYFHTEYFIGVGIIELGRNKILK